jgi:hypothetical protein
MGIFRSSQSHQHQPNAVCGIMPLGFCWPTLINLFQNFCRLVNRVSNVPENSGCRKLCCNALSTIGKRLLAVSGIKITNRNRSRGCPGKVGTGCCPVTNRAIQTLSPYAPTGGVP